MTCQNVTVVLRVSIAFALLVGMLGISACSGGGQPAALSDILPKAQAWDERGFHTPVGTLQGAVRAWGDEVAFYIEGDGRAYISAGQVSGNPTPVKPVALDLAKADAAPLREIVYLARPCQYVGPPMPPECLRRELYTLERWSEPVVEAYVKVVSEQAKGRPVLLNGFSGGAYIALAVASRLPEGSVKEVRTYGGNLLPNHTQAHHGAERLDVAAVDWAKLASIPMVHHVGRDDRVIPANTKQAVLREAGVAGQEALATGRWRWVEVEASHTDGWGGGLR